MKLVVDAILSLDAIGYGVAGATKKNSLNAPRDLLTPVSRSQAFFNRLFDSIL
jgi:hypothetical protein